MPFTSCAQVNNLFIEGQQYLERNLIKLKYKPTNVYYGRMPEGSFPMGSGMTQKGFKLARQAPPDEYAWRKLQQEQCTDNTCDFDPKVLPMNGSDTYEWYPVSMDLRTDWLCLDSFLFREFPEEELAHVELGLQNINQHVNEEFSRSWYLNSCDHKWLGLLPSQATEYNDAECEKILCGCDTTVDDTMWAFETFPDGLPNTSRLRVKMPYNQLYRISALSLGQLDEAIIPLEREGDYIMDSVQMFDAIVPDLKISRQLQRQDDIINRGYRSVGGYDPGMLNPKLGVMTNVGNYAIRRDPYAARYAPAAIADQPVPANFSDSDIETWALLIRVFPFKQEKKTLGVGHEPNKEYTRAPFSISTFWQPQVGKVEKLADTQGYGTARKEDYRAEGYFHWKNPDWQCNVKRNKGFWMACYRMAWHPRRTDLGHAFLHRLDHRIKLEAVDCDITTKLCDDPVSPYTCTGIAGTDQNGANVVTLTK